MHEPYGDDEHEDWPRRENIEGVGVEMLGRFFLLLIAAALVIGAIAVW